MSITLRTVTPPANPAVTLDVMRAHLRVTTTDDDTLIATYTAAATDYVERIIDRALITRTLSQTVTRAPVPRQVALSPTPTLYPLNWPLAYPRPLIELRRAPLIAVSAVTWRDLDAVSTTLTAGTDYVADATQEPGQVRLAASLSFPNANALTVTYTAGYGATADAVPISLRQAIMIMTAHMYEGRGDVDAPAPSQVNALISPFKIVTFGANGWYA